MSGFTVSDEALDLLSLGIELDEGLIDRLKNLGMEALFDAAATTKKLIHKDASSLEKPKLKYRNVVNDKDNSLFNINYSSSNDSDFSMKDLVIDDKFSTTLLRELDNKHSNSLYVGPQYRVAIEKMIGTLKVQYVRSPDKFVYCLYGKMYNAKRHSRNGIAESTQTKMLLKERRYVGFDTFREMLLRVYPNAADGTVEALFRLLCHSSSGGGDHSTTGKAAVNRSYSNDGSMSTRLRGSSVAGDGFPDFYIDMIGFLDFLKTASTDRRSFDSNKSRLANEVEFWNRVPSSSSGPSASPRKTASFRVGPVNVAQLLSGNAADPKSSLHQPGQRNGLSQARARQSFEFDLKKNNYDNMASALTGGKGKKQPFQSGSSSPRKQRNGLHTYTPTDREIQQSIATNVNTKVASLLGQSQHIGTGMLRAEERNNSTVYRPKAHVWTQEYRRDQTPMSVALGGSIGGKSSPQKPRPRSAGTFRREIRGDERLSLAETVGLTGTGRAQTPSGSSRNTLHKETRNATTVAGSLGFHREDLKGRKGLAETSNSLASFVFTESRINNARS